jgi:universal stress protein A
MTIERILVPIDFSERSLQALDDAVEFSRPYNAEIIVLFVLKRGFHDSPLLVPNPRTLQRDQKMVAEDELAKIATRIAQAGVRCRTLAEFGGAYETIVQTAETVKADLIVISASGRTGLAHVLIGSVAERVVQHANCPILLLREPHTS